MKVLVTGGAGYIGSHTIVELFETGQDFEIISIDNFSTSQPDTFERIEKITGKRVKNYNLDITDFRNVKRVFEENPDIETVIHFAAFKSVEESVENPLKYYHNNITGLINLLSLCNEFNINKFIFSSSCTVYGKSNSLPLTEDSTLSVTESPYGETKAMGERIVRDYANANPNFKAVILRYFNPVGAHISGLIGENPKNKPNNLVPIITQTAAGILSNMYVYGNDYDTRDGSCVRDYIHITDIANAHYKSVVHLSATQEKSVEVFNLGTGNGVTVLEAINAFIKVSKQPLNYKIGVKRKGDLPACYASTEKANKLLNWKATFSIEKMMETAWKWQLNQLKN